MSATAQPLTCPKCERELREARVGDVRIDVCDACRGFWFDEGELSPLLRDRRVDEATLASASSVEAGDERVGRNACPRCSAELTVISSLSIPSLEMDVCRRCGGIWLGIGEFARLRRADVEAHLNERLAGNPSQKGRALAAYRLLDDVDRTALPSPADLPAGTLRDPVVLPRTESQLEGVAEQQIPVDAVEWRGKIRVLISGFGAQSIVTTDEIVAAIEILPDVHLQGLENITYDPERTIPVALSWAWLEHFQTYRPLPHHAAGQYVSEGCVAIYTFATKHRFYAILYHEIGHYVYHRVLAEPTQSLWRDSIYAASGHVSEYASRKPGEDFAETYMHYVLYRDALASGLPAKHAFMRDAVFRGFAPNTSVLSL